MVDATALEQMDAGQLIDPDNCTVYLIGDDPDGREVMVEFTFADATPAEALTTSVTPTWKPSRTATGDTDMAKKGELQFGGNGHAEFKVSQTDMGGWLRVYLEFGPAPHTLGIFLSQSVADWFRRKPGLRIRCVVPITRDGNTVELHVWYEAHIFEPTEFAPKPKRVEKG